jgi:Fe-S cluster assembly protein SufD
MTQVAERQDQFLAHYDRFSRGPGAAQPAWLRELRIRAMTRFSALGIPTTRDEEYRFTHVGPIAETMYRVDETAEAPARLIEGVSIPGALHVVLVNGRLDETLSRAALADRRLTVTGLARAIVSGNGHVQPRLAGVASFEDRAFAALNTAFLHDGVLIEVPPGTVLEIPIQVIYATAPGVATMSHPRLLASIGSGAQLRLVETYVGTPGQKYFTNAVSEYFVGENASIDHYKDQRESASSYHVGLQALHCDRSSTFVSHNLVLGGQIVRNDVVAILDGEGVDCTLNGLYLSDGQRLVDNHTLIDHAKAHCGSHELYKGILAGRSKAVFNGKIIVRQDAQKTDAKQTNRALLLSDEAQINTKPQLEIFADDVKCTHGAAIGQLDEEALFYLRARGLNATQARDMLIHAFAGDILNRVKVEPLRLQVEAELFAQLERDGVM